MSATDFKKGDRVTMTLRALENGLEGKKNRRWGIVVGYSHNLEYLRVKRNGEKHPTTYAPWFWKKDTRESI